MSVWCPCKLIIYLILIFQCSIFLSGTEKGPTSGPYRIMIERAYDCESPSRPYMKDSPITFTHSITNSSNKMLLTGNITITRNCKNVKYRLKSFIWENDKWRVNYIMNDIGCHGMILHLITAALNLKYDKKNCMFLKGTFVFKDMDVNMMPHLWASKMEYGKILWRAEIYSVKQGTYFCTEFVTVCEPLET